MAQQISRAVTTVGAIPIQAPAVWRAVFTSLTAVFDRCSGHGASAAGLPGAGGTTGAAAATAPLPALEPAVVQSLRALLFRADLSIEALRLLRADAIVALARTWPALVVELQPDVAVLRAEEQSPLVRDRLAALSPA